MSLRWCVHRAESVSAAVRKVASLGFRQVEVCGLTQAQASEWAQLSAVVGVEAVSVHAPCPDNVRDGQRFPGDWLLDPDTELRTAALGAALGTIRFARDAGIGHVVFHLGTLNLAGLYRKALAAGQQSRMSPELAAYMSARELAFAEVRDNLLSAVEALLDAAAGEVRVCVENRYRFDQVPNLEDAAILLDRFPAGSGLAYWHDTGHEAAQRYLGLWDDDILSHVSARLVGVHLHDCVGTDDHRPPGEGVYPFAALRDLLRPGMPLVLELDPAAGVDRVLAGARYATKQLCPVPAAVLANNSHGGVPDDGIG
jgi:sugar phosphate isomerase/epimerase